MPTAQSLAAVLERVQANEHPFDLILATGDLSQDHSPESYQRFASMMAPLARPSTGCPATTTTAPDDRIPPCGRHQRGQATGGDHWQVILLDTQVRGKPHGVLGITSWRPWIRPCASIPSATP